MGIPMTLEEATSPAWLSSILAAKVVDVAAGPVDDRVSTNVPVTVRLADGRSLDLWIKGYFGQGSLMRIAGVPEVHFYRELATTAGLPTPRCVYAEVDDASGLNVLVTEDVGPGARFLDGIDPCTPDQTAESLRQLAGLHATTWRDPRCADMDWLASRLQAYTMRRSGADIAKNLDGPNGSGMPRAARDGERLFEAYKALGAEVAEADPWCVVHGDVHIRNVFLDPVGQPTFIDWQLVQRGPWYLDVGYHIATMLSIEDRRRHQDELVEHYLDHLVARGIDRPTPAEVDNGLRRSFVHGLYLWAITMRVPPASIAALLERLGTAADDHDAYGVLAP